MPPPLETALKALPARWEIPLFHPVLDDVCRGWAVRPPPSPPEEPPLEPAELPPELPDG